MRKKTTKLLLLAAIISSTLFYGCKKGLLDAQTKQQLTKTQILSKFFNENKPTNATIKKVYDKLKTYNENVIVNFAKQNGYPVWNKGLVKEKSKTARDMNDEDVVEIPCTEEFDDGNYIEAILVAKIGNQTIGIAYSNIEDYKLLQTNIALANQYNLTAQEFVEKYMFWEYIVFNKSDFEVTDKQIYNDVIPAEYNNNNYRWTSHIGLGLGGDGQPSTYCYEVSGGAWEFTGMGPGVGILQTDWEWEGHTECDNFGFDLHILNPNDFIGGGGGGSGGGGGGGPKGGSGPSNPNHHPYHVVNVKSDPTPCNPVIDSLINNATFRAAFNDLNDNASLLTYEKGYYVYDRHASYYPQAYSSQAVSSTIDFKTAVPIEGFLHSHPPSANAIFSPDDVYLMAQVFAEGYAKDSTNLYFGIASKHGPPHLLVIKNPALLRKFYLKMQEKNKLKELNDKYSTADQLATADPDKCEKNFLLMMQEEMKGALSLYRGNSTCTKFEKLSVDSWGDVSSKDCN